MRAKKRAQKNEGGADQSVGPSFRCARFLSLSAARRSESGLTLIELMSAMMILAIVMTGVAYGLMQAMGLNRASRDREAAANLVAQALDAARATTDIAQLTSTEWTESVNDVTFTLLRTVNVQFDDSSASPCDGSANPFWRYKTVAVQATWESMVRTDPVEGSTLVTPGIGSFDPNLGNIAVKVVDATGDPVVGVRTEIDRDENGFVDAISFTDDQGCAFIDSLQPGNYGVAGTKTSYVDAQGASEATGVVGVAESATASVQFELDRASTLVVGLPADAPTSVPITLANPRLLPTGTKLFEGSTAPRTITDLFPFPSGYQMWAGSCADADPEGIITATGLPFYPAPGEDDDATNRGDIVEVIPGASAAASVQMAILDVVVTNDDDEAVDGAVITATHVDDFGLDGVVTEDLCTAGEEYSLGTTSASGQVLASLPFGAWQVEATKDGTSYQRTANAPIVLIPPPPLGYGPTGNPIELSEVGDL